MKDTKYKEITNLSYLQITKTECIKATTIILELVILKNNLILRWEIF